MKINDYIITGGENLNDPARKTPSFSKKAESIFYEWYGRLSGNIDEGIACFELPVDNSTRLFIRAFWDEKPGCRPVCYYIGLLVTKENYIAIHDYFKINNSLRDVSLDDIKEAVSRGFVPVELDDTMSPRSAIGMDFEQLKDIKLYGEKDFEQNITQICLAISVNTIDDWFTRLFIAINPYRLYPDFHIVISKQVPLPAVNTVSNIGQMGDTMQKDLTPDDVKKTQNNAGKSEKNKDCKQAKYSANNDQVFIITAGKVVLFLIFLLTLFVALNHFFICQSKLLKLENENKSLHQQLNEEKRQLKESKEKNSELNKKVVSGILRTFMIDYKTVHQA